MKKKSFSYDKRGKKISSWNIQIEIDHQKLYQQTMDFVTPMIQKDTKILTSKF